MHALEARPPGHPRPTATLRPARAEDAAAVGRFLQGMSATSRRLRFHGHCNPQSATLALGLCRVDGVRHQAWLAWAGQGDAAVVVGEARFVRLVQDAGADTHADAHAGPAAAELAMAVADDWQGSGLADALMAQLLHAAAAAGVGLLYGEVLDSHVRMQAFMRRHGFEADPFCVGGVLRLSRAPACHQGRARARIIELATRFVPAAALAMIVRDAQRPRSPSGPARGHRLAGAPARAAG